MTPPLGTLTLGGPNKFELSLPITDGLRHYYRETKALLHSIMQRNGCRLVEAEFVNHEGAPHRDLHFSTAHQVGSCRMADSSAHGVVNAAGEVFGYPGMYVSDGAAIPTSLAVNTSLTILANAERVAAGIRARYQTGRPAVAVMGERAPKVPDVRLTQRRELLAVHAPPVTPRGQPPDRRRQIRSAGGMKCTYV
jgi:hypothetical protein